VLDITNYYFSEKGFEVSRIDGSMKLDDWKRQVCTNAWITQLLIIHLKLLFLICFVLGFEYEINHAKPFMIFIGRLWSRKKRLVLWRNSYCLSLFVFRTR